MARPGGEVRRRLQSIVRAMKSLGAELRVTRAFS